MTGPTRGERNHNPGNLRYSIRIAWQGEAQPPHDEDGYCRFIDDFHGLRALALDLWNKWARGLRTIKGILEVYAPANENDTAAYEKDVSVQLGVAPDKLLDFTVRANLVAFMRAIIRHENGRIACDPKAIAAAVGAIPMHLPVS